MKKLLLLILSVCTLCACTPKMNNLDYNNLNDDQSIKLLKEVLLDNGIPEENVETLVSNISSYNKKIDNTSLIKEGNKQLDINKEYYDMYDDIKMSELLDNDQDFTLNNCRLTAYQILKGTVELTPSKKLDTSSLFVDQESMDKDKYAKKDQIIFNNLYTSLKTSHTLDVIKHEEVIKKYMKDTKVVFKNSKVKLIRVYMHNFIEEGDDSLLVGHAGVLVPYQKGFLFVEKLSFQMPYQMIYFDTTNELKTYLNAKYDVDQTGEMAKPIFTSNDEIL